MAETNSRPIRLDALAYGGDYNPDQWTEEVWLEDARLMREAGVNMVSLPMFSWPQLETAPGQWNFLWLDRVIEILWAEGIRIDLSTATATPPSWLVRAHPEMLPQNADGITLEFGSRQAYCPSAPVWRENVARMARVMAERYGAHPALAMWHVSNEYGDHIARCWCPASAAHFRQWLKARYGTLAGLNEAWGTTVWGQAYFDWAHIETPRVASGPINPTQLLDFERFSSDALLELFQLEVDVLREVTPNVAVTTNFMSLFRELDYWDFAAIEDVVTDDAYPDPADPLSHIPAALNYSLMRALKGGAPWLLLEQAPGAVSWRDVNVPKAPGQMRIMSLHAIAHGSDGVMFFQWRQAKFGPEKFHSAMLGHRGEKSLSYQETKAFGAELTKLEPVRGTRVRASVGLVVDWDSWWASSATESLPSQRLNWLDQTRAWHRGLFALGQTVDPVRATGPFDGYDVLVVPNLYALVDDQAAALREFVAAGGRLVFGPFSGVVDHTEKVHSGGAPGPLRDVLGVEVDNPWPISDGERGAILLRGTEFGTGVWSEWVETQAGTEIVGEYLTGELAGRPAVTRNEYGDGSAWYVSAVLEEAGLQAILREVLAEAGLRAREAVDLDLEIVTRTDGDTDFVFVLNHGRRDIAVDIAAGALDLLTGDVVDENLTLPRFGAAVLQQPTGSRMPMPAR